MAVGGLVNLAIVLASGLEPVGFWELFFVGIGQGIMMWAGALPCVLPVSYTHLDVYKRQVFLLFWPTWLA